MATQQTPAKTMIGRKNTADGRLYKDSVTDTINKRIIFIKIITAN